MIYEMEFPTDLSSWPEAYIDGLKNHGSNLEVDFGLIEDEVALKLRQCLRDDEVEMWRQCEGAVEVVAWVRVERIFEIDSSFGAMKLWGKFGYDVLRLSWHGPGSCEVRMIPGAPYSSLKAELS